MRYVHGYSPRESERLRDQSGILEQLLHKGTSYKEGSKVLEVGCGIGAQTRILARRSPHANFISVDISRESLLQAREIIKKEKLSNVTFLQENIFQTGFSNDSFDHIFICFVLEHLDHPLDTLAEMKRIIKPGGSITVIEGDHGSCFWYPESKESLLTWNSLITAQENIDHDPLIGRRLYPLLVQAGFKMEYVSPRWVYADSSNPMLLDGVVNRIIVPMVESAKEQVLASRIIPKDIWIKGISDLSSVGIKPNGTFFYTWFKALCYK